MAIEYRTPTAEHVPELGRICYEAFKDIAERHGFEPDFASAEFAAMVIGMLLASETHYAIAAFNDDEPAGSNYLLMSDEVAAVGPDLKIDRVLDVELVSDGRAFIQQVVQAGVGRLAAFFHRVEVVEEVLNLLDVGGRRGAVVFHLSVSPVVRGPL